jgi:hypothetical protein
MGQCFSLSVPNTNVSINAGAGPVDGMSFTTDANSFHHANVNAIHEADADLRAVCGKVLGAIGNTGVILGSPCTIQVTAGGAIQVYAGAGLTADIGDASGPGDAFGPSSPASFSAGERAASMNRINDFIGAAGSVAGGVFDMMGATNNLERAAAALAIAKGGWDATKAATGYTPPKDGGVATGESAAGYTEAALGVAVGIGQGDYPGIISSLAKGIAKKAEGSAANAGAPTGNPTPATGPTCVDGAAGGALGAPGDSSARIHEVAPANIDRKCGKDMTAEVAGNKKTTVDGKIDYMSGASITIKAFNKISTQSLFFDATGLVAAKMTGYAKASVESFGKATLSGKYKVEVKSMVSGKVEAKKLEIKGKATMDITSPKITMGGGTVTVTAPSTFEKNVVMKNWARVSKRLQVGDGAEIKTKLDVDGPIKSTGKIHARQELKNPYFKAG